jgi:hypothetical protein
MVLLAYFLIAAIAGIAASAIVGLILTNLVIRRFTKAERPVEEQVRLKLRRFIEAHIPELAGKVEVTARPYNTVTRR